MSLNVIHEKFQIYSIFFVCVCVGGGGGVEKQFTVIDRHGNLHCHF